MMKKMFFVLMMGLGLIAVAGRTALRAMQAAGTPSYADTIAWIQQNITGQATQNNGRALWSYDSKQPSQTHISILSLNYETSDRRKHQYS
jgi:hypothetical protein